MICYSEKFLLLAVVLSTEIDKAIHQIHPNKFSSNLRFKQRAFGQIL
jgi:hypothetical protein